MSPTIDPFPRASRRDRLARVLGEFADVAIRAAEPGTVDVPHDPATLDVLGVCATEYTAAARDLAAALGCDPLEAGHLLDAVAVAFTVGGDQ